MSKSEELQELYSKEYYGGYCRGGEEFKMGKLHESFNRALEMLPPCNGEKVIDLGCGRGEMANECGKRGCFSIGVDFSMNALKTASKNANGKAFFVLANATALPFKSGAFEKAFFLETIEHIPKEDEEKTLSEMRRVLSDGGKMAIATSPSNLVAWPLYAIAGLLGMKRGLNERMHVNEKNYFSLRSSLRKAGFSAMVRMRFVPEWFEVAVKGKRFDFFFLPFVAVLNSRLVKWLCGRSPFSVFCGTHLEAFAEKEFGGERNE